MSYACIAFIQNIEAKTAPVTVLNQTNTSIILNDSKLLTNYSPDQINEIIYRLYQEIQNSNSSKGDSSHDIAILIDFICSDESIENAVEACDIVTELPIDKYN
jgi:hypothetical protein